MGVARSRPASTSVTQTVEADELIGRLYHLGESVVMETVSTLSPSERANLATFCYRKSHLHRVGLAIAATCDQDTLIRTLGSALGRILYAQSREHIQQDRAPPAGSKSKITLARGGGLSPTIVDFDDDIDAPGLAPEPPHASLGEASGEDDEPADLLSAQ
jgi:hypothetical protein